MKYEKTTRDFSKYLYSVIDRHDWGYFSTRSATAVYANENWLMEAFRQRLGGCFPEKLTMTTIQSHLLKRDKLYYTSARGSGFALVCIDVDAHRGQTDSFEMACWIRDRFFPGSYLEVSNRGYHVYVLFRVGWCRRWKFNMLLAALEVDLSDLAVQWGFQSTLEVLGGFTEVEGVEIVSRAHLAPLPTLPNGQADLHWLSTMPTYLIPALKEVGRAADVTNDLLAELLDAEEEAIPPSVPDGCVLAQREPPTRESSCAWERMTFACFDYTAIHRKLPDVDELLAFYQQRYGTDDGDRSRRRRATYAIRYRAKTFDPEKLIHGGYATLKDQLMQSVRDNCIDRTSKYEYGIEDEDLAIALYVVHVGSFTRHARPQEQWTVGNGSFKGMFDKLARADLTTRGCGSRNKSIALKTILMRSGLIECLDSRYVPAGGYGISKKYTIGPSHWLYAKWCRWAEGVAVKKVADIIADRKGRQNVMWETADEGILLA